MIQQVYEPRISHEIFVASKNNFTLFHKVRITLDTSAASILPRRGCSAYSLEDKVFIFGGVYEREFNYLNLQNDIVTMDLSEIQNKNGKKLESIQETMDTEDKEV